MLENISSDEHPKFERQAHAPYNFVPLPARVLTVLSQEEIVNTSSLDALNEIVNARLPAHNTATTAEQFTGYFEVILETFAPLYVRGPMTTEQFKFNSAKQYANGEDIKENKVEFRRLAKNLPEFFFTQDKVKPVIPGSSLRGMLRSLVEVITYSKFVAVSKTPRMFYRAVADEGNDPRRQTYKDWIGNNASKVSAGFLTRNEVDEKGEWFIQPAKLPKQIGGRTSDAYIKIDDTTLVNMLQGYVSLNSKDYVPQFREVSFDAELQEVQSNKPNAGATNTKKLVITAICNDRSKHAHVAWLACSGNMLETADWSKNRMYPPSSSPRKKQYLILEFGKDEERPPKLRVSKSVIDDYITSLTPYQQHTLGELGICHNGHPVFFTKDAKDNVTAIGHSPNFRIPSKHWEENRAVTPADFVPDHLKRVGDVDMAEAIFGFTRSGSQWKELCDIAESLNNIRQGHPLLAYSGRVSVTDATLHLGTRAEHEVFEGTFTPKILASPKPSTFQHYLTQSTDEKPYLKHFADSIRDTQARGHKMYWHKGNVSIKNLQDPDVDSNSTQHTQLKPVRSGNVFHFRVYFDRLSDVELGALAWALTLPGETGKQYTHSLGMGKPLGMGAVALYPTLVMDSPKVRYNTFVTNNSFTTSFKRQTPKDIDTFVSIFEKHLLAFLSSSYSKLADVPRIANMLRLMAWPGIAQPKNAEYMTIEPNEYKDRRVLPYPEHIEIKQLASRRSPPSIAAPTQFVPPMPKPLGDDKIVKPDSKELVEIGMVLEATVLRINRDQSYQCDLGFGDTFQGKLKPKDMVDRSRLKVGQKLTVRVKSITTNLNKQRLGATLSTRPDAT